MLELHTKEGKGKFRSEVNGIGTLVVPLYQEQIRQQADIRGHIPMIYEESWPRG